MILNINRGESTLDVLMKKSSASRVNPNSKLDTTISKLPKPLATEQSSLVSSSPPTHSSSHIFLPYNLFSPTDVISLQSDTSSPNFSHIKGGIIVSLPLSPNSGAGTSLADSELRIYDLGRQKNWKRWWSLRQNHGLVEIPDDGLYVSPLAIIYAVKLSWRALF